jgi:hypothetical protein
MVVRSSTVVERGSSPLLGPEDRHRTGRRPPGRTCGTVPSAMRSSWRSTSPSWQPVLAQRRMEQLLLRLPVKLLLAAVAITSDSVGAITSSLSPPHGDERNGECLGAKDIWVSRVAWKYLTPGHFLADLRPLDADALHRSPLGHSPEEACNAGRPACKRLSRGRRLTAPRRSGRGSGCRSGLGGRWIRAQAPAGPGRIDWNQVTRVSAVVSPSGASWTTAFRNGVILPAELEPRLVDVERLPALGRQREPKPTITSWIVIAAPPGLLPIGSGFLLAGYS